MLFFQVNISDKPTESNAKSRLSVAVYVDYEPFDHLFFHSLKRLNLCLRCIRLLCTLKLVVF